MSICMKVFCLPIKLFKRGFVANVKWREEPGFGMLHHTIMTESEIITVVLGIK